MLNLSIKNQKVRKRMVVLSYVFIAIYIIAVSVLFLIMEISNDLLRHFIFSIVGMIGLLILNLKYSGSFLNFLTMVAAMFYIFTSFGSICFSLVRNDLSAFQNLGILENTDGFLFFVVLGYLIFINKNNKT